MKNQLIRLIKSTASKPGSKLDNHDGVFPVETSSQFNHTTKMRKRKE